MRVRAIAAFAAGIVVSALLVVGPVHAQPEGVKAFVGFGVAYNSGRATLRAPVQGTSVEDGADIHGGAYELQLGVSRIGGTGMFTYLSLGRWDYDAKWQGIDVEDKETMVLLNVGHEWDVGGAHPWLALSVGKVNDTAYGMRGGYKFRLGESVLIGPRVDLLVINTDESSQAGRINFADENTNMFGIGLDLQYRFDMPGSK